MFFEFCCWKPFNWSATHSTGPRTLFLTDISVMVAQKKFQQDYSDFGGGGVWEGVHKIRLSGLGRGFHKIHKTKLQFFLFYSYHINKRPLYIDF